MLVSCWTLFRRLAFINHFRERLWRVFIILALPLLPLNDCTLPSYFHWEIVLYTVQSPMAIIWDDLLADFPAWCEPITCRLSKTELRLICRHFPSVIIYACCRGEKLQYWLPVKLNATIVTIFFFFKIVMRKPVNKNLHYIYILPGLDKLFGRVDVPFWIWNLRVPQYLQMNCVENLIRIKYIRTYGHDYNERTKKVQKNVQNISYLRHNMITLVNSTCHNLWITI